MYSGYNFGTAGAQNFNNGGQQQQSGMQQGQQQMMYNQQQQFAGMSPQGAFNPSANPQMMAGGHAGMMQNAGMQHMANNGQMAGYPQQFPYGQVGSGSVGQQNFGMPNNFMMGGGMQGFPMNQGGMSQQQQQQQQHQMMQQRMPQQQANHPGMNQMSTPQRPPSAAHSTPSAAPSQQFQPPQQTPTQSGTPSSFQGQPAGGMTPSTPTFPTNQGGPLAAAAPGAAGFGAPGADPRDKQRFALLLDINHELLYESIQIQTSQQEIKKELAAQGTSLTPDRKPTEEEHLLQQDYIQCMRRLQVNLAYMASLAGDRKADAKVAPYPAVLTPPNLNLSIKLRAQPIVPEGGDFKIDPITDREERDLAIKELYQQLQGCFPGVDPNKELGGGMRGPNMGQGQKPGAQGFAPSPTTQKTPQMMNMPGPLNQGGMGS